MGPVASATWLFAPIELLRSRVMRMFAGALALLGVLGGATPVDAGAAPSGPSLVLVIAVDQLRRDRVDGSLPGGLGALARESN